MHDVAIRLKTPGSTRAKGQGCQFGFCEAKFVILGFLSTPLTFFNFWKRPNEIWIFWASLANYTFYVDLADLKKILADFWLLADL